MIRRDSQLEAVEYIEYIECDVCKKVFDAGDFVEMQEFHHIDFQGGYGSVFGDGNHITCDMCQSCLLLMIDDFCRSNGITKKEQAKLDLEVEEMHDMIPDFDEGDDEA